MNDLLVVRSSGLGRGATIIVAVLLAACGDAAFQAAAPTTVPTAEATVRSGRMYATPPPHPERATDKSYFTVADELVDACRLELGDPAEAPKFESGESTLAEGDDVVIRIIAECVKSGPLAGHTLLLVGRADRRGTPEQNLALGLARAHTLRARFEVLGVEHDRIRETSRGEGDAHGSDEASRRLDRRVDIVLFE